MKEERRMRRDAAQNRIRLVESARAAMRDGIDDVSLDVIAERAGVSRGTVYRNFEDRQQLYAAVLEQDVERIGAELRCPKAASDLPSVMRRLVELMAVYDRFRDGQADAQASGADACPHQAMLALLSDPISRARDAGYLRPDASNADVLLACRMVASGWRLDLEPSRDAAISRRLALILKGLGTDKCRALERGEARPES